jgi:deazaflavin-dependent oxidoreductase (nitroreductase family)
MTRPFRRSVAQLNKHVTNPITRVFAGWLPGFAVVTHTGRRSGRTYRTPVNIFRAGDEYIIALIYGADSDWVKNVSAAGGCELTLAGKTVRVTNPRIFVDPSRRPVPFVVRFALRLLEVEEFLALRPA